MIGIRNVAFYSLFLHVLAAVVTTSARSTAGLATVSQDVLGKSPVYEMMISQDEENRLVELLGPEYLETGLIATKVTGPPRHCSICGKQTEFVDWVFTALARGVHSPEFIVESLKLGNSPKKLGHDVYCSRCGHLTHFRDATGEEGSAPYIAIASPYNRATRTFAPSVFGKRAEQPKGDDDVVSNIQPVWHTLWTRKREESAEAAPPLGAPNWKRSEEADAVTPLPPVWHTLWTRKREEVEDAASLEARGEDTIEACGPTWAANKWQVRSVDGSLEKRCIVKREKEAEAVSPLPPVWHTLWTRKREVAEEKRSEDSIEACGPSWSGYTWQVKRDDGTLEKRCIVKREEDAVSPLPPVWHTLWTRKRGEEAADAPLPPVWHTLWTRKREEAEEKRSEDTIEACGPSWSGYTWQVKRADGTLEKRCIVKREEEAVSPLPPVWHTLWTRKREEDEAAPPLGAPNWKRGEEAVDAPLPPVWHTLWTRKREETEDAPPLGAPNWKRSEDSVEACGPSWASNRWQVRSVDGALDKRCIVKRGEELD